MTKIRELPKSSSRLLTSAQIISSVYCVVKELIENALDSVSKNVEVKLEDYGLEKIEVKDNGCGIDKNDIEFVAKPHFTSKITTYSDLDRVESYGFRGEALGAICNVADLVITTKSSDGNIGIIVNYGHDGQIISTKPCPCAQGTTVSVLNLFKNIPVRRQYYRADKNKKDDLRKIEDLLISFGCIQHDVRFALYHNKNLIWQKPALSSTKNALIHILGNSVVDHMKYIEHIDEHTQRKIEVFLPKLDAPLTCGLSTTSRCITAINKRPVRIKAIDKLLKDYYNKAIQNYAKSRYPICYISFTMHLTEVDVNVEPNKTTVLLHHSEEILEQLSEMLKTFYAIDVTLNINNPIIDNASPVQDPKSNATDFLNSVKAACNAKLQQSSLVFMKGNSPSLENSSVKQSSANVNDPSVSDCDTLTEKDINRLPSLKEPCKKKLKTTASKKDIDNHINTMKNFFAVEEETNVNKLSNVSSNFFDSAPTVTVQRNCLNLNGATSSETNNSDIDSERITTFAVSSNISSNHNQQVSRENINNQKQHLSNSSASHVEQQNNVLERPVIDVNKKNGEAWSRGTLSSGEFIQPVTVLQPKTITMPNSTVKDSGPVTVLQPKTVTMVNSTVKDSGVSNSNIKQQHITTSEANFKRPSECNQNKQTLSAEKDSLLPRKITAFDIFCRSNRLEVAAQNPQFNNQQIAQVLSEKWNRLSAEEKAVFGNKLNKEYKQDIKKKVKLGKTISQNLSESKMEIASKSAKMELKLKIKEKNLLCNMEHIKRTYFNINRVKPSNEELNIINYLAPGIWVCRQKEKLYLLNTFRLQEAIIYHRLLETFQFDTEPLQTPQPILTSNLGEDAMTVLMQLSNSDNNINGKIGDERLTSNGFQIRVFKDDHNEFSAELTGLVKSIAFYGLFDLKELLLLVKEKGLSSKLSQCRPSKILLYLQSEANRMSRQSPACQRLQDVEDLLNQMKRLPPNCDMCIHHKTFFNEIWKLSSNV